MVVKLVHYSSKPVGPLSPIGQKSGPKPRGLWVSDDDCDDNWRTWCVGEGFGLDRLTHVHDVELMPGANVLRLASAADIDAFDREWRTPDMGFWMRMMLPWGPVSQKYAGLIITPYVWERRLSLDGPGADWYYTWDCASGCIWDPAAIQSITLRAVVEAPSSDVH
jgi:hypothetical protein